MGTAQSGERTGPLRQAQPADVAIVGLDCLLPKAPGVRRFWANLLNKVDAITDVPGERFNIGLYYDQERKARDKIYSRWGGFLEDVPFDPLRYGIPPNALASIDPMQLLSLVVVDRALRDAGYHDRDFPRETTSVIFGVSGGLGDLGVQYAVRATLPHLIGQTPEALLDRLPAWTEDSFAGILPNVVAGRIANRFNLGGVNFTVDAACAASLAAVYIAVRELNTGSSDMVITGRDEAQAASTVKFTPPRLKRLAIRPATTLGRMPAKESSVHAGRRSSSASGVWPIRCGKVARTAY